MTASQYKLNRLIAFVDYNNLQIDGKLNEVKTPEPIDEKFKAFGFNVINIDGHDFNQIIDAINKAKQSQDRPSVIIAKTIKGKGISFMENQAKWHGKAPNEEEYEIALKELM
jgi:transketolase